MQPPFPFYKVKTMYDRRPDGESQWRLGQWFMNIYAKRLPNDKDDAILYNTTDNEVALNLIRKLYEAYQWEM